MAGKKKTKKRKSSFKVSILGIAGLVPGITYALAGSSIQDKGRRLTLAYTGYDSDAGVWSFGNMTRGAIPLVVALLAKKVLNKLGAGNLFRNVPLLGM